MLSCPLQCTNGGPECGPAQWEGLSLSWSWDPGGFGGPAVHPCVLGTSGLGCGLLRPPLGAQPALVSPMTDEDGSGHWALLGSEVPGAGGPFMSQTRSHAGPVGPSGWCFSELFKPRTLLENTHRGVWPTAHPEHPSGALPEEAAWVSSTEKGTLLGSVSCQSFTSEPEWLLL